MVISAVSHLTEGVFVELKELSSTERRKTYIEKKGEKKSLIHIKVSGFGTNRCSFWAGVDL